MTEFHRTNLNLYTADVEFLQRRHGTGWTTIARDIIHDAIRAKPLSPLRSQIERDCTTGFHCYILVGVTVRCINCDQTKDQIDVRP